VSCTTKDSQPDTDYTYPAKLGDNVARTYIAGKFTAGSSYDLDKFEVYLKKNGSPTATITASVCNDSSGSPSATCTGAGTLDASTLTTSYVAKLFALINPKALTSGASYWIVLQSSAISSSNWVGWGSKNTTGGVLKSSETGASWSSYGSHPMSIVTYTCD
jgi:hypothetical protein